MRAILSALRLSILIFSVSLLAQETTGSMVGVIKDSSGSVVAGAEVTAVRQDTGMESRTASDAEGNYQFALMRAGTYRLLIEHPGFQRLQRNDVVVNTTERIRLDLILSVGSVSETISVTA